MRELGKVVEVRTNITVQFKSKVINSISAEKDKAIMEMHPAGVYVYCWDAHLVIPFGNIAFIRCEGPKPEVKK